MKPRALQRSRRGWLLVCCVLAVNSAVACSTRPSRTPATAPPPPEETTTSSTATTTSVPLTTSDQLPGQLVDDQEAELPGGVIVFVEGGGTESRLFRYELESGRAEQVGDALGAQLLPSLSPAGGQVLHSDYGGTLAGTGTAVIDSLIGLAPIPIGAYECPAWTLDGTAVLGRDIEGLKKVTLDGVATVLLEGPAPPCGVDAGQGRTLLSMHTDSIDVLEDGRRWRLYMSRVCRLFPVSYDPTGDRVAFTATCAYSPHLNGVYVMGMDDVVPRHIAKIDALGAEWSPDGKWLAISYLAGNSYELWALREDGLQARRLRKGNATFPSWGPEVESDNS